MTKRRRIVIPFTLNEQLVSSAVQSSTCPCTTGVKLLKSLITE